jgi:glycine oxidase
MRRASTWDVIVIGGGVIGCAIARELALGGVRVLLIERQGIGAGASGAAAGTLAAQAEAEEPGRLLDLAIASRALYASFLEAVLRESGLPCEHGTGGILYCALDAAEEDGLEARARWQRAAGLDVRRLSADEARAMEPELTRAVHGASHYPDDHWVDPRGLAAALGVAAQRGGVEFATGSPALRILCHEGAVAGVECEQARFEAPLVVNAAGCWASLVGLPPGVAPVPVFPQRGEIVLLAGGRRDRDWAIYSTRGYVVPRGDGRLLAGSTYRDVGYDARVSAAGAAAILAGATALVPALAECPLVGTWAGLRPATPDGLPILGRDPDLEGLVYATGHGRHGILLAPLTARLVADLVIQGEAAADLTPFSVARFRR